MDDFGKNESLWVATSDQTNLKALSGNLSTDVLVIGAGITGLMTAYYLSLDGKQVAVIDSDRIITGTTGYTSAKVTAAHGSIYHLLLKHYDKKVARTYADSNSWAIGEIESIIKENSLDCDFIKRRAFTYAVSDKETSRLREEYKAAKSLGLPVLLTDDLNVPFPAKKAVLYENQAQFHPRNFLLGIVGILEKRGVQIYENTRAISVDENEICLVKTDRNQISAEKVIITTNNQFQNTGLYSKLVFPYHSFVTAYKTDGPLVEGMYYSDDQGAYSIRDHQTGGQDYLLVGGEGIIPGQPENKEIRLGKLINYAQKYFGVSQPAFNWQAQDNISYDLLPLIGLFTPESKNVYVATGFSAWGMTKSIVAAKLLSDLVIGTPNDWSSVYSPWAKVRDRVRSELKGKFSKHKDASMTEQSNLNVQPGIGVGKIITENGEQIAVFKTFEGAEIRLSPVCTHKGCVVEWNNKDQTWDCPCHGSRYSALGKVIHGPAPRDLDKL